MINVNCRDRGFTSNDSVPLKLTINIGLLLLEIGRSVDLCGRHDDESSWGIWVSLERKENEVLAESRERLAGLICVVGG